MERETSPVTFSASQVRVANCAAASSSVTGGEPGSGAAGPLAEPSVGVAASVGVAPSVGSAGGVAASVGAGEVVGVAPSVGVAGALVSALSVAAAAGSGVPSTGRNRSCAVAPSSRACSPSSPGTEMTMFDRPR